MNLRRAFFKADPNLSSIKGQLHLVSSWIAMLGAYNGLAGEQDDCDTLTFEFTGS
jgi:hypothetical protein